MRSKNSLSSLSTLSGLSTLVYSTDSGRICPGCQKPVGNCNCHLAKAKPAGDGIARVQRQTKGRGGKAVTVIQGLALESVALEALAKSLRTACGSGGTVKDGVIEVQGDHVERVMALLAAQGFVTKRSGG